MIFKNIKILILILILMLCLPTFAKPNYSYSTTTTKYDYSGTYINEEINVPVTKIGISQEIFEDQQEAGLEISWNKWHANMFNELADRVYNSWVNVAATVLLGFPGEEGPRNYISLLTARVNSDMTVENVMTFIIFKKDLEISPAQVLITRDTEIYMYNSLTDKYYRWFYFGDPLNLNVNRASEDEKIIKKLLSNGKFVEQEKKYVYESAYLKKIAKRVKNLSGKSFLKFPQNSKRKFVNIFFGITDINEIKTIREATEDMYDDIERHK